MKTISKITIGLFTATLLFVGCNDTAATPAAEAKVKPTISEESLGLRKTDLYSESTTESDATHYTKNAAGSGHKIARAFQDAPPMIPHDVEGMVPITINDNQCIACHDPMVAKDMGATPYPSSHMTNFRASSSYALKGINTSDGTLDHVSITHDTKLVGARFNCTQCHASQSDAPAPKNNFEAVFTHADGATASSWSGTKLMEGIDTTK